MKNTMKGVSKAWTDAKSQADMKSTMSNFQSNTSATDEDVALMAKLLGARIAVFGKSGDALQMQGDETSPVMELSNVCSTDGAGDEASHFRFLWRDAVGSSSLLFDEVGSHVG